MIGKITIATLLLAGSSLYAKDQFQTEAIVGANIGYTMVQGDTYYEPDYDGNGFSAGLRMGAKSRDMRALVIFDYYNNDDDNQKVATGILTLDYFFLEGSESSNLDINPYLGVNIGYGRYTSTNDIEESGLLYGGQLGITYSITQEFELDFGYRHSFSNIDTMEYVGNAALAVHYKY